MAVAEDYAQKSLEAARRSGDQAVIGQSEFWVAWIENRVGQGGAAARRAERAMLLGRRTESRFLSGQSYGWLSRWLLQEENWTGFKQLADIFLSD